MIKKRKKKEWLTGCLTGSGHFALDALLRDESFESYLQHTQHIRYSNCSTSGCCVLGTQQHEQPIRREVVRRRGRNGVEKVRCWKTLI
jgi:hypothetical protein